MADSSSSIVRDLLLTPDDVFNRETKSLDSQMLLELAAALQSEMRTEQGQFGAWSSQLSKLDSSTDHASADFRRISSELTRSQNRLAQLLARSDRCLDLQRGTGVDVGVDTAGPGDPPQAVPHLKISVIPKLALGKEAMVMAAAPAAHGVTSLKVKVTRKVVKPAASRTTGSAAVGAAADQQSGRADGNDPDHTQPLAAASQIRPSFKVARKSSDCDQDKECGNVGRPAHAGAAVASPDDARRQLAIASFQHLASTFAQPSLTKPGGIAPGGVEGGSSSTGSSNVASDDESSPTKRDSSSDGVTAGAGSLEGARGGACITQTNVGAIGRTTRIVTLRRVVKSKQTLETRPASTRDAAVSSGDGRSLAELVPGLSVATLDRSDLVALSRRPLEPGTSTLSDVKADVTASTASDPTLSEQRGLTDKAGHSKQPVSISSTEASSAQQPNSRDSGDSSGAAGDQLVHERVTVKDWNPAKLLSHLYALRLAQETTTNSAEDATTVVNRCGYLEHLPIGKKKMTLLKTWRKSYFKAENGFLYTYDSHDSESARSYLPLMDGSVENVGEKTLLIDNGCGLFAMVRCRDDGELSEWQRCLVSQTRCSANALYLRPVLAAAPDAARKVVVIDIGGCSVRAGIVGTQPSLPQLFFPAVALKNPQTGCYIYGCDTYSPENRHLGKLIRVLGGSRDPNCFINSEILSGLLEEVVRKLCIDVSEYTVLLSLSHALGANWREVVARLLLDRMGAGGVCLVSQAVLSLYLYGLTSGVVVNVGDCVDIAAITEGYLVSTPGGCRRLGLAGGQQIEDDLAAHLTAYALYSPVEKLLVRYVKETSCYVSADAREDAEALESAHQVTLDLSAFDLPAGRNLGDVTVGSGRFASAEGLLRAADGRAATADGADASSGGLSHAIARAVLSCPVDARRAAWRGVCLCGGASLLPGLAGRLQAELNALAPPGVVPRVHASIHRYHAAYIGACWLARLPGFSSACVTQAEWTAASAPSSAPSGRPSAGLRSALLSTKWGCCFSS